MKINIKLNYFKVIILLVFFITNYLWAYSQVQIQNPLKIKEYKLENGLTVILNEDHTQPLVFGAIAVKAGSKNDPPDATGMAHYQEHMLFKGTEELGTINWDAEKPYIDSIFLFYDILGQTKDVKEREKIQLEINRLSLEANKYAIPNEFSNIIKEIGGTDLNAETGPDQTLFYNAFPPHKIEQWLEIYSHRFINPVFRSFQAELEVVYEEKNLYNDIFIVPLLEKFGKNFFKVHPYGQQTTIGTIEHLKNPSLTKMYHFFKTWYVPNNMALVLCGDFNSEEIMPLIKEKFEIWQYKELPPQKTWHELPFKGKEKVVVRMSPIKLALLGFRTPPVGHKDEPALEVMCEMLSNENKSGLLDKLVLDNKLIAAEILPMNYNDYGASIILIVPKIFGQSIKKAEELVIKEIQKIKNGDFSDDLLQASKNSLYLSHQTAIEDIDNRALLFAETFTQNIPIDEVIKYPQKIKAVNKEDVIKVANEYFNNNYLAFYSKIGFPKKEKIDKPNYKPVLSNSEAKSQFAVRLSNIPDKQIKEKYFDFNKDIKELDLKGGNKLIWNNNPYNDIFSMVIRYKIGEYRLPLLKYVSRIMNYAGTSSMTIKSVKDKFSLLGCNYDIYSNDNYFTIKLQGIEENLENALTLINEIINKPVLEKAKIKIIVDEERTTRKLERSEPDNVSNALFEYVKYGNKSQYIDRLSIKDIKNLNVDTIINIFHKAVSYETEIYYTGTKLPEEVKEIIEKFNIVNINPHKSSSPEEKPINKYDKNIVFAVNKKNATQSKINFLIIGKPYDIKDDAAIEAFNLYFGGDFSGLALQEIREYRSLAYEAEAAYNIPLKQGYLGIFEGYLGTQADKTISAIQVFDSLLMFMPLKPERINMIKNYLIGATLSDRPSFRKIGLKINEWRQKGYTEDPAKILINQYKEINFNTIVDFYKKFIEKQYIIITITGNQKRFNLKDLEKFGDIIQLKEKQLFKNK